MSNKQPKFARVEDDAEAYVILRRLVGEHHPHLSEARIVLVWARFKSDRDDNTTWGQARKVSELEQQFHDDDLMILLNDAVWAELSETARRALVDHELSHFGSKTNDDGDVSYYLRQHDVEEFASIVERYGLWRTSVEGFVKAALRQKALANEAAEKESDLAAESASDVAFAAPTP